MEFFWCSQRISIKGQDTVGQSTAGIKQTANIFEPPHDKTIKMACVPSEDSDRPGHLPSLIRVFSVHSKGG